MLLPLGLASIKSLIVRTSPPAASILAAAVSENFNAATKTLIFKFPLDKTLYAINIGDSRLYLLTNKINISDNGNEVIDRTATLDKISYSGSSEIINLNILDPIIILKFQKCLWIFS